MKRKHKKSHGTETQNSLVKKRSFRCIQCRKKLKSETKLSKLVKKCNHDDSTFIQSVKPTAGTNRHKNRVERNNLINPANKIFSFKCTVCWKTFKSETKLSKHVKKHNREDATFIQSVKPIAGTTRHKSQNRGERNSLTNSIDTKSPGTKSACTKPN